MPHIDESLFLQDSPDAAVAALAEYFAAGGVCIPGVGPNWPGIVEVCQLKSYDVLSDAPEYAIRLCWAILAIQIREAMAASVPGDRSFGLICGAMWVRVDMIRQSGKQHPVPFDPHDVVRWCLECPKVQAFLQVNQRDDYRNLDPEVKGVAEMLANLVVDRKLNFDAMVGRLLDLIVTDIEVTAHKRMEAARGITSQSS